MIAMIGDGCVAIASDMRFGVQQQTIMCELDRIYSIHPKLYVGLSGLVTDMQTLHGKLQYKCKMYSLREERLIQPHVFSSMLSNMLYEKRFGPYFIEPLIAGLIEKSDGSHVPYISGMDLIGAPVSTNDFLVSGTASEQLFGVCEAMYKPNMSQEQLFETISQCLLAAVDRDCLAGWGANVFIITKDGVTSRQLKSRKD